MPVEQVNGTPIAYEVSGAGEPLVLVHGAWVDQHSWAQVVPALAESFRVITYDLRGHGQSTLEPRTAGTVHDDIADLVGLIGRLGGGPVNVAGISSGACIALRLTAEHPELVRRTLAHEPPVDSLLAGDPETQPLHALNLETLDAVQRMLEAGEYREAAEQFVEQVAIGPGAWAMLPPPVQDVFVQHAPAFLGQLNDPDALLIDVAALGKVSTPILMSQGNQSPPIFPPIMAKIADLLPNAQQFTYANAGHVPHMTNPPEYVAMVTEFLRR